MASTIVKHDWNGHSVRQRSADGYVNLTDMCKATGYPVQEFLKNPKYLEVSLFLYQEQHGEVIRHPMQFDDEEIWTDLDLAGFYARNAAKYSSDNYSFLFWFNRTLLQINEETYHLIGDAITQAIFTTKNTDLERLYAVKSTDALYASPTNSAQVYFILIQRKKQVKIGFSKNPESRQRSFAAICSDKLDLKLTISGGIKTEQEVHSYFAEYRIGNTELFHYAGKLKDYLNGDLAVQWKQADG